MSQPLEIDNKWKRSYAFEAVDFSALLSHDGRLRFICDADVLQYEMDDEGREYCFITLSAEEVPAFREWLARVPTTEADVKEER